MPLEQIGQKLKSAREAQGLSLLQVYERTKIPINHLKSIESGIAEDLPETVYVSGFIKRYADCVGLDGQVLSDEYRSHLDAHRGNVKGKSQSSNGTYASPEYISKAKVKVSTPFHKVWLFNSLIIICVLGTIAWFINTQATNIANQPDPSLLSLRESTSRLAPTNVPVTNQPGQPANPDKTPVPTSEKISLSAGQHVWVEIKKMSNGESIYNGFMEQGDRRDFEDSQGLFVRAGDGGSLSVERQGKIEPFGLAGKITERTFSLPATQGAAPDKPAVATQGIAPGSSTIIHPAAVKRLPQKRATPEGNSGRAYRRIDEGRQYMPGESLGGGTRSIDVPYRYSEGRLDTD